VLHWLNRHHVQILNVAGSREEKHCPIYENVYAFLTEVFRLAQNDGAVYEPAAD